MELFKLLLLIACSAVLVFLVLPAITVFFVFRAREPQKFARRAKAGVIIGIVLAVLLLGIIVWDAVDLLLPDDTPPVSAGPSMETTEATEESTAPPTETESTEATETFPLATISDQDLEGVWIAAAEPHIPEDENYTLMTQAGYYQFGLDGSFIYTQLRIAKTSTWEPLEELFQCSGTYELNGDILTLHYTMSSEKNSEMQTVDYTEEVSMLVDRTCTDMCVRTPDHPKLGQLLFFRKGRASDPINSILILLNGGL